MLFIVLLKILLCIFLYMIFGIIITTTMFVLLKIINKEHNFSIKDVIMEVSKPQMAMLMKEELQDKGSIKLALLTMALTWPVPVFAFIVLLPFVTLTDLINNKTINVRKYISIMFTRLNTKIKKSNMYNNIERYVKSLNIYRKAYYLYTMELNKE